MIVLIGSNSTRTSSGRIAIQSKGGHLRATVGYQVTVPASHLRFNRSSVGFLSRPGLEVPHCRPFSVRNDFALPVRVAEVSVERQVIPDVNGLL